ncbi:hypothetical protein BC629DRAFT_1663469 [Irpex lacteus]|nr:hypothetical protein BC629DRAFT_1663469 [Irpex lacteus]
MWAFTRLVSLPSCPSVHFLMKNGVVLSPAAFDSGAVRIRSELHETNAQTERTHRDEDVLRTTPARREALGPVQLVAAARRTNLLHALILNLARQKECNLPYSYLSGSRCGGILGRDNVQIELVLRDGGVWGVGRVVPGADARNGTARARGYQTNAAQGELRLERLTGQRDEIVDLGDEKQKRFGSVVVSFVLSSLRVHIVPLILVGAATQKVD